MTFLYWIKQKVTTGLRILFPEPKAKAVSEEEINSFLNKYESVPRSPKGKEKVYEESSTNKESKADKRLIDKLKLELEEARGEQLRLRGLVKDRGTKVTELTNELDKANSTIDKYNAKTKEIMIRDERAKTLIKDQRDKIDDLTSKLQRNSEENKELVSRVDTMSKQVLSKGIISDNEKIKELEGRLDKTTEYLASSKRNLDEKADEINTLTSLNDRLVYELGQAKEVNEDCDVEIEELKGSNESLLMINKENDNLKQRLAENETIRKELESKLVKVQSSKDSSNTKAEDSIIKEKDIEINELKDANVILKDSKYFNIKATQYDSIAFERSRKES